MRNANIRAATLPSASRFGAPAKMRAAVGTSTSAGGTVTANIMKTVYTNGTGVSASVGGAAGGAAPTGADGAGATRRTTNYNAFGIGAGAPGAASGTIQPPPGATTRANTGSKMPPATIQAPPAIQAPPTIQAPAG